MNETSAASGVKLWHTMTFADAEAMMTWLRAVGFVEHETFRDEADPSTVVHAEWVWPAGGGGLMFGSQREDSVVDNVGCSAAYLVTDAPDAVFDAALAAGGTVLKAMEDQDFGGRGGSLADPEGNHWSIGSYQPR